MSEDLIEIDLMMNCSGRPANETALVLARYKIKALQAGAVRLNLLPAVWSLPWEQPA